VIDLYASVIEQIHKSVEKGDFVEKAADLEGILGDKVSPVPETTPSSRKPRKERKDQGAKRTPQGQDADLPNGYLLKGEAIELLKKADQANGKKAVSDAGYEYRIKTAIKTDEIEQTMVGRRVAVKESDLIKYFDLNTSPSSNEGTKAKPRTPSPSGERKNYERSAPIFPEGYILIGDAADLLKKQDEREGNDVANDSSYKSKIRYAIEKKKIDSTTEKEGKRVGVDLSGLEKHFGLATVPSTPSQSNVKDPLYPFYKSFLSAEAAEQVLDSETYTIKMAIAALQRAEEVNHRAIKTRNEYRDMIVQLTEKNENLFVEVAPDKNELVRLEFEKYLSQNYAIGSGSNTQV